MSEEIEQKMALRHCFYCGEKLVKGKLPNPKVIPYYCENCKSQFNYHYDYGDERIVFVYR